MLTCWNTIWDQVLYVCTAFLDEQTEKEDEHQETPQKTPQETFELDYDYMISKSTDTDLHSRHHHVQEPKPDTLIENMTLRISQILNENQNQNENENQNQNIKIDVMTSDDTLGLYHEQENDAEEEDGFYRL
jgi:hypothetical protein